VTVIEPSDGRDAERVIVFVHGGGGCRFMFLPHARLFAAHKTPYRCVLLDLPGHGVQMDVPLTTESAIASIASVTQQHASITSRKKPFYIGGSLGGYIGMELAGHHPDLFAAMVITMCGQNVGVGAGFAARMGLSMMKAVVPKLSAETLLQGMLKAGNANGHLNLNMLVETSLRTGSFFQQNQEQIAILRNSNPLVSLPKYNRKILFVNGSKDHRDSELKWKSACNDAKLIVYEGADHFFSHDDRYMSRFMDDMNAFFDEVKV
jgi:pimeloyl-ACP methyl ester carboxylesterase